MGQKNAAEKTVCENRKARHDYFVEESYECGIELKGTEVKSLRQGKGNLKESFAHVKNNEVFVEDFAGTPQFELDCLAAVRAFFSNYPTDRAAFPPAVQQWLPLPMFFFSRDTM